MVYIYNATRKEFRNLGKGPKFVIGIRPALRDKAQITMARWNENVARKIKIKFTAPRH